MAFADPQSITVNGAAKSLALISSNETSSVYQTDDGVYKFTISHQKTRGRVRHMVRVDYAIIAANVLTSVNEQLNAGIYLVIDEPQNGYTDTELDYVVQALKAWLTTANDVKVLTGQH